jgi:putative restriction endonuclease
VQPFIVVTDKAWFDYLLNRSAAGIIDEVNFWSPQSTQAIKIMAPGEPVFFRLKRPFDAIAGYAFFAHFRVLDLDMAWDLFSWKNGDPDRLRFLQRIGDYRGVDLLDPSVPRTPLGCTILRAAVLWTKDRWIPWGPEMGWAPNIVRGKSELDADRVDFLLRAMANDAPAELEANPFELMEADERLMVLAAQVEREGQGTFRARLLDAYEGRCAITGEHTELVLDAAHIQPYLGPRSNHLQNGLLLTKEFHTLFDRGYVTVTPDRIIRVSPRLRSDYQNGRRYYPYDGQPLAQLPCRAGDHPSRAALAWHNERIFRTVA